MDSLLLINPILITYIEILSYILYSFQITIIRLIE